jgi:CRP/FNR family transcriptional regulator
MENSCKFCTYQSNAIKKLSEEEVAKLSFNCVPVKFKKGDSLIKQGTFSTNVAYLKSGLVKIHIAGPYYEQIVRILKAPEYLGLPTTVGDKINQYSVTAIDDAEVCFIDIDTFNYLLRANSEFSYEIILSICQNELQAFRRCANRTQKQIRGKIADFLLELSTKIYDSNLICIPLNQEEIGNLIDASRESVSRVFSEFEKDELIITKGKQVEIINTESLKMISSKG